MLTTALSPDTLVLVGLGALIAVFLAFRDHGKGAVGIPAVELLKRALKRNKEVSEVTQQTNQAREALKVYERMRDEFYKNNDISPTDVESNSTGQGGTPDPGVKRDDT